MIQILMTHNGKSTTKKTHPTDVGTLQWQSNHFKDMGNQMQRCPVCGEPLSDKTTWTLTHKR